MGRLTTIQIASSLFILLSVSGCWPLAYERNFLCSQEMSRYGQAAGGIDSLIDIDGIYLMDQRREYKSAEWDGNGLIFYNDGSCSTFEWTDEAIANHAIAPGINLSANIAKYRPRTGLIGLIFKRHRYDLCGGSYTISNDTVTVEYVDDLNLMKNLFRLRFKVIDRRTLRLVGYDVIQKDAVVTRELDSVPSIYNTVRFMPATNLPSPLNMYNKRN